MVDLRQLHGGIRLILCFTNNCTRKPTRLVDNYCSGVSLRCGFCCNSIIDYYDRVYGINQFIYPELYEQFLNEQIIEVECVNDVQIQDRNQGAYIHFFKLTLKQKKQIKELVV